MRLGSVFNLTINKNIHPQGWMFFFFEIIFL